MSLCMDLELTYHFDGSDCWIQIKNKYRYRYNKIPIILNTGVIFRSKIQLVSFITEALSKISKQICHPG